MGKELETPRSTDESDAEGEQQNRPKQEMPR